MDIEYKEPVKVAQVRRAETVDDEDDYRGKISDVGQIDVMPFHIDFNSDSLDYQRVHDKGIKPGEYFSLGKADGAELEMYVQEHKPCSQASFNSFVALTKKQFDPRRSMFFSMEEVKSVTDILKDKLDQSKYETRVRAFELGGRQGLDVKYNTRTKPQLYGAAFYMVADPKNRIIEEVGFKNGRLDKVEWIKRASYMMARAQFKKPR
ncbi:MAG: hypothetical protein K2X27_23330 [Candidatus Obscuribacterales bacterium]|nr:hypothetical protein [Candidatus Obscuribacterales bacterium]